jgi:hypothetical protein
MTKTFVNKHGDAFSGKSESHYIAHILDALCLPDVKGAMDPGHHAEMVSRWTELKSAARARHIATTIDAPNDGEGDDNVVEHAGGGTDPVALFAALSSDDDEHDNLSVPADDNAGDNVMPSVPLQARLDAALRRNKRLVAALELCIATATGNDAAWIRHVLELINDDDA